jgi:hypothetical protein
VEERRFTPSCASLARGYRNWTPTASKDTKRLYIRGFSGLLHCVRNDGQRWLAQDFRISRIAGASNPDQSFNPENPASDKSNPGNHLIPKITVQTKEDNEHNRLQNPDQSFNHENPASDKSNPGNHLIPKIPVQTKEDNEHNRLQNPDQSFNPENPASDKKNPASDKKNPDQTIKVTNKLN